MDFRRTATFALALALTTPLTAMQTNGDVLKDSEDALYERIEVLGKRPVIYYKRQYQTKRDDFLASLNALVSDRDMVIKCKMKPMGQGTRIKREYCTPHFLSMLIYRETQFSGGATTFQTHAFQNKLAEKKEQLMEHMAAMIASDPDLRQKYLGFAKARQDYELADSYFARQLDK